MSLPVHPLPPHVESAPAADLRVDGLVESATTFSPADLAALPRVRYNDDFACEAGWTVPDLRWEGVRLTDVIALAGPSGDASYVRVGSGDFVMPLTRDEAARAVLCDTLDGAPLAREHGAPWRLLLPGGLCFTSVKWVDRIELAGSPGENSAESIARARLRAEEPS